MPPELQRTTGKAVSLPACQFASVQLGGGNGPVVKQLLTGKAGHGRQPQMPGERGQVAEINPTWSFPQPGAELWVLGCTWSLWLLLELPCLLPIGKTGNEKDEQQRSHTSVCLVQPAQLLVTSVSYQMQWNWCEQTMMCCSVCLDEMCIAVLHNCSVQIASPRALVKQGLPHVLAGAGIVLGFGNGGLKAGSSS